DLDDVPHPHDAAVGPEHAVFHAAVAGLPEKFLQLALDARAVVGMQDLQPLRSVGPLLGRMAEEPLDLGSDVAVAPGFDVPGIRHDAGGFDQMAHAALALAEPLFGQLSFGDVAADRLKLDRPAGGIEAGGVGP